MNKTNIKCPRCHSKKLYKFSLDLTSRLIKNINVKNVVDNSRLTPSVAVKNPSTLDVLSVIKLLIFTINIRTIIVINVEIESVIMHSLNITI